MLCHRQPCAVNDLADIRLSLMSDGLRCDASVIDLGLGQLEGIDLILQDGRWVNVSCGPSYADTSPWELRCEQEPHRENIRGYKAWGGLGIHHDSGRWWPVRIPNTIDYRRSSTVSGHSCGDVAAVHGDWLVCAPFAVRDELGLEQPERFVGVPYHRPRQKGQWSVDDMVCALHAARKHTGVRWVHIEASHVLRDDAAASELAPYIRGAKTTLNTVVSVSVAPSDNPQGLLELYAAGADAVACHLLAWNPEAAERLAPQRARILPHAET